MKLKKQNISGELVTNARQALLLLLSDLRWHHNKELRVAGVRYSARLLELRRLGYRIEKRSADVGHEYRLLSLKPDAPQEKRVKVFLSERDATAAAVHHRLTVTAALEIARALGSFQGNRANL